MRARLLCKVGKLKGKDFEVTGKLTIGRSADSSVVLRSKLISSEHAQIVFDGSKEQYYLEDLGSLNGTDLDGIPVAGRERLDRLHVISFGGAFDFIWQGIELCANLEPLAPPTTSLDPALRTSIDQLPPTLEDLGGALAGEGSSEGTWSDADAVALPPILAQSGGPSSTPAPQGDTGSEGTQADLDAVALPPGLGQPPDPPAQDTPAVGGFVLLITHEQRMHRVRLQTGENLVGRQQGAEVFIDHTEISRRHAVLTVSESKVRLRDEGSRNRTYLDGQAIDGEVEVKPGSQVRFGVVEAILVLKD